MPLRSHAATCVSYAATWANASVASRWRVATDTDPCSRSSPSTGSYCEGETTTATESRFFAAARMSVGPPMSMFSMIVSSSAPLASVSANGYRDETTRSIGSKLALGELTHVLGVVPAGEDACVDRRMQRADAAVEHLREAGDVGDRLHLDARIE